MARIGSEDGVHALWLQKKNRIREFKREASRLASMANKRVARLERNDFTDSPAYRQYIEGGGRFGIRGKTYNEIQSEVARLNRFLDSTTSTIRGANRTLKEMAFNTNIKYKDMKDLKAKASKFFELQSKVEQYLRSVDDIASAIGYQKIWDAINIYTDNMREGISDSGEKLDDMILKIADAIKEQDEPVKSLFDWYIVD